MSTTPIPADAASYPTMDPDVKARWLAALRSGRYLQGVRRLSYVDDRGAHRYCCLGILCELAVDDGVIKRQGTADLAWYQYGTANGTDGTFESLGDSSSSVLPTTVMTWAGLREHSPTIDKRAPNGERTQLASLNDAQTSFAQIADLIESYL